MAGEPLALGLVIDALLGGATGGVPTGYGASSLPLRSGSRYSLSSIPLDVFTMVTCVQLPLAFMFT